MRNDTTLSVVASQVFRVLRNASEAHADVDAWHAPRECHRDVARGTDRQIATILEDADMTADELYDAIEEATTPRFAYDYFGELGSYCD